MATRTMITLASLAIILAPTAAAADPTASAPADRDLPNAYTLSGLTQHLWQARYMGPLDLQVWSNAKFAGTIDTNRVLTISSVMSGRVTVGQQVFDTYGEGKDAPRYLLGTVQAFGTNGTSGLGGPGTYQLAAAASEAVRYPLASTVMEASVFVGTALSVSGVDTASTGSKSGVITFGAAITQGVDATPYGGRAINGLGENNVGAQNGVGFSNIYTSKATSQGFDIGVTSRSIFNPSDMNLEHGGVAKYDNFHWLVGPHDTRPIEAPDVPQFGTQIAEWNVSNYAADSGFLTGNDQGPQPSGGLLLVPEIGFLSDRSGLNASFGFSVSHSGETSTRQTPQANFSASIHGNMLDVSSVPEKWQRGLPGLGTIDIGQTITDASGKNYGTVTAFATGTGGTGTYKLSQSVPVPISRRNMVAGPFDFGKFYMGYGCFQNSIAGLYGRCIFANGDQTGQPNQFPYSPLEIDGGWKHGIDMTLARIEDGNAVHLADGQAVALSADGKTRIFYETSSGKVVIIRGGHRVAAIDAEGNMTIRGRLTQNGSP